MNINKVCDCIHAHVCKLNLVDVCQYRTTFEQYRTLEKEIESLKSEINRPKDKYEPNEFHVESYKFAKELEVKFDKLTTDLGYTKGEL